MTSIKSKQSIRKFNKGFIALTIVFWCLITLLVSVSLQSEWLSAYIYADFYNRERKYLINSANRCLEKAYQLYISGIGAEKFEYFVSGDKCYGKTGDILEATTTNSHFWYATTTKIHR